MYNVFPADFLIIYKKPCFLRLFLIFFSRCVGSYMTNTFWPLCRKYGLASDIPSRLSTKDMLLEPWSQIKTYTWRPTSWSLPVACLVKDCSTGADAGPEVKKYPMLCFHLEASPLTMNAKAWFATNFVCSILPKSSKPSIESLCVLCERFDFMVISSKRRT